MSLVAVALATACATTPRGEFNDTDRPVSWAVDGVTLQSYPNGKMKWLYRLRLRETAAGGAVLSHVKREARIRGGASALSEWGVHLDFGPHDELRVTCAYAVMPELVFLRFHGRYEIQLKQTYLGRDGRGAPFEVPVEMVLDNSASARKVDLIDFARFAARTAPPATTPSCEAIPEETTVFDPLRHNAIHFFVAVDNTGERIPIRTQWFSPSGKTSFLAGGPSSQRGTA